MRHLLASDVAQVSVRPSLFSESSILKGGSSLGQGTGPDMGLGLVSWGCCNKTPQTGHLRNGTAPVPGPEVWNQSVVRPHAPPPTEGSGGGVLPASSSSSWRPRASPDPWARPSSRPPSHGLLCVSSSFVAYNHHLI